MSCLDVCRMRPPVWHLTCPPNVSLQLPNASKTTFGLQNLKTSPPFCVRMVNTRYIHFRVTRQQYDAIKINADVAGCKTVSEFLRKLALDDAPAIQRALERLEADFA